MSSTSGSGSGSVPEREEIDEAHKWDLESVYASDEDWEAAYEAVKDRLPELEAYEGRVTEDGETLLEVLELRDALMRRVETVHAYARMRSDEDTRDQAAQAMSSRARSLAAEARSAASFIEPEIQRAGRETLEGMIEATDGLERYAHHLDDVVRMREHTRSAEVEALLSELDDVLGAPSDAYSMLTNADLTFPTVEKPDGDAVEITQSNFTTLLKHEDRGFRRTVYEAFYEELATVRNTVGSTLKHQIKKDVKLADARGYETAREAALDGPNVPVEVYDTLVETVHERLPTLHRHVELLRDALGVEELRMWDVYRPIPDSEPPDVEYGTAREHVVEALAPLGEDYQRRVAAGLDSRWVDVYENRGKRSGAYSGGAYDTQPFILMNYQDDISSMYTLAHELGHSLHSQLTSEHQPYVYADYEIFVAEVASTVNEALLTRHLLETVEDETFRAHVLNEYLRKFTGTLYRQTMFADFEQAIHEAEENDEALTPDRFDELYRERKAAFYEPAELDDHIAREWMRIPHFYYGYPVRHVGCCPRCASPDSRYRFDHAYYVYQYSTGISSAVAIVKRILEKGQPAVDDYLDSLKLGGSEYPVTILRRAGVDPTRSTYIEQAIDEYSNHLDQMASLVE